MHTASPASLPGTPDPWLDSDPWACQPCEPTAQEGQCHLDPFGNSKGKDKGKGERGLMTCYNCLGLGHPVRVCPSEFGAGVNKSVQKCKTCGGFGHDTSHTRLKVEPCTLRLRLPKVKARARAKARPARAVARSNGAKVLGAKAKAIS